VPPSWDRRKSKQPAAKSAAPDSSLLYRINVAEAKLGVSRSTIYRLVKEGKLELVKIGRRSSGITVASILAMIEGR